MKIISVLVHPLLLTTYSFVLIYVFVPEMYSPVPAEAIPYFIGAVFVTTFIIPVISMLFMKLTQRISSLEMSTKEERLFPLFSIGAFYAITTYLFYTKMNLPKPLFVLMMGSTLLILFIFFISMQYRISIHTSAIWGMAGIFSALAIKYLNTSGFFLPCLIFLGAGISTTAGLYLDRHTPAESWSGAALGFSFCFFGFFLYG